MYTGCLDYCSFSPPASAVEDIKSVPCICVCVRLSTLSWLNHLMYWFKIYLNNIADELEGQGHRSKVKIAKLKNIIFEI